MIYMKDFLHHIFLPKTTNNYRPKLLHHKILFSFIVFFFSAGILMSFVKTNFPSVLGSASDVSIQQLLIITNEKRQENGLSPLTIDNRLTQAATNKASDMFSKNYWAHNSPDGTTPWWFIKNAGYNYIYAGENLARGFSNASDVVNAWMASPEHRQNMLSVNYQNVGFAVAAGSLTGEDTVLVVEELGSTSYAPAAVAQTKPETVINAPASPSPVPSVSPSPTPAIQTVSPVPSPTGLVIGEASKIATPLINGQSLSLLIAKVVLAVFIFVLIMDMIIIERKKIVRFVGHNLDHIFFLSLILLIILILTRGSII